MKKFVKILCSTIVVSLLISATNIMAFANDKKNTIDNELKSRGYPDSIINEMLEDEKQQLINEDCYFESAKTTYFDEHGNIIFENNYDNQTVNTIIPYGQIKEAHLKLTWATSNNSNKEKVVSLSYRWYVLPINRFQDPIAVSWDDNYYTMKINSFTKTDKYTYVYVSSPDKELIGTASEEKQAAKISKDGVVWYADLKGNTPSIAINGLYGNARFTLIPKKLGETQLYGHYVHKKLVGSVGINIPKFGSFQVTGSGYDEMGSMTNVQNW